MNQVGLIFRLVSIAFISCLFFSFVLPSSSKKPKQGRFIVVVKNNVEADYSEDSTAIDSFLSTFLFSEYVYNEQADSMLSAIDNFNVQISYGRVYPCCINAAFVSFNYKGVNYSISSLDSYYIEKLILPNIEDNRYDWAYNAICYAVSQQDAGKLKFVKDMNEWRVKMKKTDLSVWKSRRWK